MSKLIQDRLCRIFITGILLQFILLSQGQVKTGDTDTGTYFPLLRGKMVGVVANNASVAGKENIVDLLVNRGFSVKRIFSPEHGFRSFSEAGQSIATGIDSLTGIPVVSLYGARRKPDRTELRDLDIVLFDIQDVGVRFYTYISTLSYVMEACGENNIPLIVLDRPNPNGFYIDGPVLEKAFASFVGLHPVPVVYGMTIGEYARMVNGEGWLKNKVKCELTVVQCKNYTHQTKEGLTVKPSPNLSNQNAILLYPSLCFFEGTIVSVGRGTSFPFEVFGHPGMKSGTFSFTPGNIPGASLHPPFAGEECHGLDLRGYLMENPAQQGKLKLKWLLDAWHEFQYDPGFFTDYFNKLAGNSTLQQQIKAGKTEDEIRKSWQKGISEFKKIRERYLMY